MAIVYQSGSVYTDTTGQLVTGRTKIAYIVFCPSNTNDEVVLRDGTANTDPIKITLHGEGARKLIYLDFSSKPMVFNAGIHCSVLSANCHLTLVLTSEGANA
jgi:hypothetical protein